MREDEVLSAFEAARPRLFALAYRMVGLVEDAEDIVQETFLRWQSTEHAPVRSADAWLLTACTRIAIDHLRRVQAERNAYVGMWLPEPVESESMDATVLSESLSVAFLVLMERLTPEERAAWLLREAFAIEHDEVARILGKSSVAVRKLVSRGRRHLQGSTPRFRPDTRQAEALAARFLNAVTVGDLEGLITMLAPDATLRSDGGGRVPSALNVVSGAERVARFLVGVAAKLPPDVTATRATLNGGPGVILSVRGGVAGTLALEMSAETVRRVFIVRNPDKLSRLQVRSASA